MGVVVVGVIFDLLIPSIIINGRYIYIEKIIIIKRIQTLPVCVLLLQNLSFPPH